MRYITRAECDEIITYTNGHAMTYGDQLDNLNVEYEIIEPETTVTANIRAIRLHLVRMSNDERLTANEQWLAKQTLDTLNGLVATS